MLLVISALMQWNVLNNDQLLNYCVKRHPISRVRRLREGDLFNVMIFNN